MEPARGAHETSEETPSHRTRKNDLRRVQQVDSALTEKGVQRVMGAEKRTDAVANKALKKCRQLRREQGVVTRRMLQQNRMPGRYSTLVELMVMAVVTGQTRSDLQTGSRELFKNETDA